MDKGYKKNTTRDVWWNGWVVSLQKWHLGWSLSARKEPATQRSGKWALLGQETAKAKVPKWEWVYQVQRQKDSQGEEEKSRAGDWAKHLGWILWGGHGGSLLFSSQGRGNKQNSMISAMCLTACPAAEGKGFRRAGAEAGWVRRSLLQEAEWEALTQGHGCGDRGNGTGYFLEETRLPDRHPE
jgi:hypothetical protein